VANAVLKIPRKMVLDQVGKLARKPEYLIIFAMTAGIKREPINYGMQN
jgi:hypothetical protein